MDTTVVTDESEKGESSTVRTTKTTVVVTDESENCEGETSTVKTATAKTTGVVTDESVNCESESSTVKTATAKTTVAVTDESVNCEGELKTATTKTTVVVTDESENCESSTVSSFSESNFEMLKQQAEALSKVYMDSISDSSKGKLQFGPDWKPPDNLQPTICLPCSYIDVNSSCKRCVLSHFYYSSNVRTAIALNSYFGGPKAFKDVVGRIKDDIVRYYFLRAAYDHMTAGEVASADNLQPTVEEVVAVEEVADADNLLPIVKEEVAVEEVANTDNLQPNVEEVVAVEQVADNVAVEEVANAADNLQRNVDVVAAEVVAVEQVTDNVAVEEVANGADNLQRNVDEVVAVEEVADICSFEQENILFSLDTTQYGASPPYSERSKKLQIRRRQG